MKDYVIPPIALIYNPSAGSGKSDKYIDLFKKLIVKKWEFVSVRTEKNQVVEQVKSLCCEGFNRIIIAGGDGTIMDVVNGIMASGRSPVVGILPQGTGNDLARAFGYYKRFKENPLRYLNDLVSNMENPEYRLCRILSVNDKIHFTNYAGLGFDAIVLREFQDKRTFPLHNRLIYLFCIMRRLFFKVKDQVDILITYTDNRKMEISVDDFKNILLINIPSFAGGLVKLKGIDLEGSAFHLVIVKGILDFFPLLLESRLPIPIFNALFSRQKPEIYKIDKIEIYFHNKIYIQIDGEDYTDLIGNKSRLVIRMAGQIKIFN